MTYLLVYLLVTPPHLFPNTPPPEPIPVVVSQVVPKAAVSDDKRMYARPTCKTLVQEVVANFTTKPSLPHYPRQSRVTLFHYECHHAT